MIRKLQTEDIEIINQLSDYHVTEQESMINPFFHCLVAIEEERIVGFLSYQQLYENLEIIQLFVVETARRKGTARQLLLELEQMVLGTITLEVRESNHQAISAYQSVGYEIVARRPYYYKNEDGYLMCKKVSE